MKKVISVLMYLLFGLTVFLPAGKILTALFGCTFHLISDYGFATAIAILSLCVMVLSIAFEYKTDSKVLLILLTALAPLSLINGAFYIHINREIRFVLPIVYHVVCCFYLTIQQGKKGAPKYAALGLCAPLIIPICLSCFLTIFFNWGHVSVVKTVESPDGSYYAQVIDDDQGALGGATIVNVFKSRKLDLILFEIQKKPQTVSYGPWGIYTKMKIYWKDNHCLVINNTEVHIE